LGAPGSVDLQLISWETEGDYLISQRVVRGRLIDPEAVREHEIQVWNFMQGPDQSYKRINHDVRFHGFHHQRQAQEGRQRICAAQGERRDPAERLNQHC